MQQVSSAATYYGDRSLAQLTSAYGQTPIVVCYVDEKKCSLYCYLSRCLRLMKTPPTYYAPRNKQVSHFLDTKVNILTNPYLQALGIPLILSFCSALAKKIVRGSSWQRTDFFLGVDLSLATIASALVYFFDLAKLILPTSAATPALPQKVIATASFLALCFFLLLWLLSTHQDWERRPQNPRGQFLWLIIIANLVGAGLFATFVLYVKGV
jgi:hypothetical protein